MHREPAVLEGCAVSNQERCKLEDEAATACTQLTQAFVQKQGMTQTQAVPQSRSSCGMTQDLISSITSAVQVKLKQQSAVILPHMQSTLQAVC